MIPVVYINCKRTDFVGDIITGKKQYETHTRNKLRSLIGQRVLIAETGHGKATVKCSAVIDLLVVIRSRTDFEKYRPYLSIEEGSQYDWKPGTEVKYLYHLSDVKEVQNFVPEVSVRHGRVWAEYNGSEHRESKLNLLFKRNQYLNHITVPYPIINPTKY